MVQIRPSGEVMALQNIYTTAELAAVEELAAQGKCEKVDPDNASCNADGKTAICTIKIARKYGDEYAACVEKMELAQAAIEQDAAIIHPHG